MSGGGVGTQTAPMTEIGTTAHAKYGSKPARGGSLVTSSRNRGPGRIQSDNGHRTRPGSGERNILHETGIRRAGAEATRLRSLGREAPSGETQQGYQMERRFQTAAPGDSVGCEAGRTSGSGADLCLS